jgi:hypothetical protein
MGSEMDNQRRRVAKKGRRRGTKGTKMENEEKRDKGTGGGERQ